MCLPHPRGNGGGDGNNRCHRTGSHWQTRRAIAATTPSAAVHRPATGPAMNASWPCCSRLSPQIVVARVPAGAWIASGNWKRCERICGGCWLNCEGAGKTILRRWHKKRPRFWRRLGDKLMDGQEMVVIITAVPLPLILLRSLRLKPKAAPIPRIGRGPGTCWKSLEKLSTP